MSENPIPGAAGEAQAAPAENPAGLLRAKREEKGLSLDDAAQLLKLQPRQVVAIEEGDFLSLGSAAHVRGFVRNYARHLDLDPEMVLGQIEHQVPLQRHELHGPGNTGVAMPTHGGRRPLAWALAASPLLLVALGLGLLYAFGVNFDRWRSASGEPAAEHAPAASASPAPVVAPPSATGSVPLAPVAAPVVAVSVPAMTPAGAAGTPPSASAPETKVLTPANPSANAGATPHRLVLNFLQDAWVEIKQGDGHTLISQKVPGGSTRIVEGKPPFSLIIGNAHSVQLQYDDHGVDLTPHTKVDVARLTLN
jgi:cytoskeleton protein RodZ